MEAFCGSADVLIEDSSGSAVIVPEREPCRM
jgi:hypothetical protein